MNPYVQYIANISALAYLIRRKSNIFSCGLVFLNCLAIPMGIDSALAEVVGLAFPKGKQFHRVILKIGSYCMTNSADSMLILLPVSASLMNSEGLYSV